ncbi:MAG: hypothetical protein KJ622_08730 [Alphaproteobacteria bacterium]|nr:hypothetical protein [Alphaproteobacteria bacterium]
MANNAGHEQQKKVEAERAKRQRLRSIAIAVGLGVLVVLFYAATIVHLGGNALNRPM